jgi:RHS repeat-associated protein
MELKDVRRLLYKDVDERIGLYAIINSAADDIEIPRRLNHPDVAKTSLLTGEAAWTNASTAPYLLRLDTQPEIESWLLEEGVGNGWGIFFTSAADMETLETHLRQYFKLLAPNGRNVYFRFYNPIILNEFLPRLDGQQSAAFFGPVLRFIAEEGRDRMVVFIKPNVDTKHPLEPSQVVFGVEESLSHAWQSRRFGLQVARYRTMGFEVSADEKCKQMTLTDKSGATAVLQKTELGVAVTTGEGRRFDYTLTACGNPLEISDPAGHRIYVDISESEKQLFAIRMDEGQKCWTFEYDDMDRLDTISYPDGTQSRYGHDAYGNLAVSIDRNGHDTRFQRDEHQRLVRRMDANGNATRFDYNEYSAPARISFADGVRFDFQYADSGALEKFIIGHTVVAHYDVDPDSGSWKVRYADGTGAEYEMEAGRIVKATNPAGTVELAYDDKGLLVSEKFQGRTVTYHRNETGHLIGITTPFGQIIHYDRDGEKRITGIREWSGGKIDIHYAANGPMESLVYPNGTTLEQKVTTAGFPAEMRLTTPAGSKPVLHQVFKHDLLGRIRRISDSGDHSVKYTYDNEGRLRIAESNMAALNETFCIDANGNRLSDDRCQYDINAADRLMSAGAVQYQYDRLGNMIRGACPCGPARYGYTGLNQLKSILMESGRAQYRYDAFGRRVVKKVNGTTTHFFWAGHQLLHEVQAPNTGDLKSAGATDYLFYPGSPTLLAIRRDRQIYWSAFGHRHEVLCLTASDGELVWKGRYDAFGRIYIDKGKDLFQPFRLAGHYFDAESGLHHTQNRYYNPHLGRYLGMTPVFTESGCDNFYIYCKGDPINHIDPYGEPIFAPVLIGASLGASIASRIEAWRQPSIRGTGSDGFNIAKVALRGGAFGAINTFADPVVAMDTTAEDACTSAATSFNGMTMAGLLSGRGNAVTQQCPQDISDNEHTDPVLMSRTALTHGASGTAVRGIPMGRLVAQRIAKPTPMYSPAQPEERKAKAAQKAKTLQSATSQRIGTAGRRYCGYAVRGAGDDGIVPVTGEVTLTQKDFILAGRVPLIWSRHYRSGSKYAGLLGRGWQCPADARLEMDTHGLVSFFDGGPYGAVFEGAPTHTPVQEAVNGAVLCATQTHFQVRLKTGLTYDFPKEFVANRTLVTRIHDLAGHFLEFHRRDSPLDHIQDSCGQSLRVNCAENRIISIARQDKLLVEYRYLDGHLSIAADALGDQKRFDYRRGRLVRNVNRNKHALYYKYDDNGRCVHTWDDGGLYEHRYDHRPYDRSVRITDSIGRQKTIRYDNDRLPITEKDHLGNMVQLNYDEVGRIIATTDALNRTTAYVYDPAGNVTEILRADNTRICLSYDDDHHPVQMVDGNGKTLEQRFDPQGRRIEKVNPLGERTRFAYDRQGDLTSVTDPENQTTSYQYDHIGLVNAIGGFGNHQFRYQRNLAGNMTGFFDPDGRTIHYSYDKKARLIQTVQPSGISQTFDWDPEDNLLMVTDPNGRRTRFEYNGTGDITRRINADGTAVHFQYDTEGHLIRFTNELGQSRHFNYDHAGRIISQTDYYGQAHRYEYDPAGQLTRQTNPLNQHIDYTYDPLGRLHTRTNQSEEPTLFNWDANGNLTAFQSPDTRVERYYDAANHLLAEKKGDIIIEFQYDRIGRRTQRATSYGNWVQYTYDPLGAVTAIQINDQPPVTIKRNHQGRVIAEHFSEYLHRTFDYDHDGLLIRQTINGATGEIERRYAYDGAANLIDKQDSQKGSWRYNYDPMNRVIEAMDTELTVRYVSYDACGDLIEHLPDCEENLRTARLRNTRYAFDAAGNLVGRENEDPQWRFEWDELHLLKSIRNNRHCEFTMAYDALGRRHSKAVNGERTFFNWDGDALLSEQQEDGAVREYVYYPGTQCPLAMIENDGQVYYYHNDVNGMPQEVTRPNGEIVWSACYDELARIEQVLVDEVAQPLRRIGHYMDSHTDLCYDGSRYFDPQAYMFISPYLVEPTMGENLYAYAQNAWTRRSLSRLQKEMTIFPGAGHPDTHHGSFMDDLPESYPIPAFNTASLRSYLQSRLYMASTSAAGHWPNLTMPMIRSPLNGLMGNTTPAISRPGGREKVNLHF